MCSKLLLNRKRSSTHRPFASDTHAYLSPCRYRSPSMCIFNITLPPSCARPETRNLRRDRDSFDRDQSHGSAAPATPTLLQYMSVWTNVLSPAIPMLRSRPPNILSPCTLDCVSIEEFTSLPSRGRLPGEGYIRGSVTLDKPLNFGAIVQDLDIFCEIPKELNVRDRFDQTAGRGFGMTSLCSRRLGINSHDVSAPADKAVSLTIS